MQCDPTIPPYQWTESQGSAKVAGEGKGRGGCFGFIHLLPHFRYNLSQAVWSRCQREEGCSPLSYLRIRTCWCTTRVKVSRGFLLVWRWRPPVSLLVTEASASCVAARCAAQLRYAEWFWGVFEKK